MISRVSAGKVEHSIAMAWQDASMARKASRHGASHSKGVERRNCHALRALAARREAKEKGYEAAHGNGKAQQHDAGGAMVAQRPLGEQRNGMERRISFAEAQK